MTLPISSIEILSVPHLFCSMYVEGVWQISIWTILCVTREYWMIYRGPGFLAVYWLGSHSPSPVRNLSLFFSLPVCHRSSLLTDESGGGGEGEKRNQTTERKPGPLYINQYSLGPPQVPRNKGSVGGLTFYCRIFLEQAIFKKQKFLYRLL